DHDDVSENSRLLKQYHYLRDHEDIDVVSSWYNIISESGRILHTVKLPVTDLEIKKKMLYECCVINSGMMIRKSVFEKYGLFIQNKFPAQDYDFFLRILPKVKFYNIPEVLHNWISREMSPSNVAYARQRGVTIEILTDYFNDLLSNSQIKKDEWCFFMGRIHYYYNSPSKSIGYFWKALLKRNISLINLKYLLFSTFLFPAIFLYRRILVDRRYGKKYWFSF
ncbi:MAG: hypothetical protein M1480_09900, partial [Bacteroidetes bacterium]|nr:hypothetical protein [Bacteroidota bacterium]